MNSELLNYIMLDYIIWLLTIRELSIKIKKRV